MLEDAGVVSNRKVMKFLSAVFLGLILLYGIRLNQHNLRYRVETLATYLSQKDTVKSIDLEKLITCPMDNHAWSVLANLNVQEGGAVWSVFSKYYVQALGGPDVCLDNIKSTVDLRIK